MTTSATEPSAMPSMWRASPWTNGSATGCGRKDGLVVRELRRPEPVVERRGVVALTEPRAEVGGRRPAARPHRPFTGCSTSPDARTLALRHRLAPTNTRAPDRACHPRRRWISPAAAVADGDPSVPLGRGRRVRARRRRPDRLRREPGPEDHRHHHGPRHRAADRLGLVRVDRRRRRPHGRGLDRCLHPRRCPRVHGRELVAPTTGRRGPQGLGRRAGQRLAPGHRARVGPRRHPRVVRPRAHRPPRRRSASPCSRAWCSATSPRGCRRRPACASPDGHEGGCSRCG